MLSRIGFNEFVDHSSERGVRPSEESWPSSPLTLREIGWGGSGNGLPGPCLGYAHLWPGPGWGRVTGIVSLVLRLS